MGSLPSYIDMKPGGEIITVSPAKRVPLFEGELETSVRPSQACEAQHGRHCACVGLECVQGLPRRSGRLKPARNFCDAAPRGISLASKEDVVDGHCPSGTVPKSGASRVELTWDVKYVRSVTQRQSPLRDGVGWCACLFLVATARRFARSRVTLSVAVRKARQGVEWSHCRRVSSSRVALSRSVG